MPSPFPGMDPFLEHHAIFPGLHDSLLTYLRESLQLSLPAPYFAEINERLWIESSERRIGPDVDVLRGNLPSPRRDAAEGGVAVLVEPATPILIAVATEENRQTYLEIRTPVDDQERVVTTIEVLSPTNKTPGPKARTLYLNKQQEILNSDSNLVEIDLLRGGMHTTAIPLNHLQARVHQYAYHVCIHRFEFLGTYAIYPIQLPEKLPAFSVPLLPGDGNVTVDLQAVFARAYDTGPYRRRIRYEPGRIVPPLEGAELEWAVQLLRKQGLIPEIPLPSAGGS